MRGYTIAASVASALLSSGVISAFARTPASESIEVLRSRVANLERELRRVRPAIPTEPLTVTTPFQVLDPSGKPVLQVTSDHKIWIGGQGGTAAFGPLGNGGYGIAIFGDSGGKRAVGIGTLKGGYGVVQVDKAGKAVAAVSDMGLITWNAAGQEITHLGADPTNKDRGELKVRGVFAILDEKFNTVIDGGTLPDGRGAIRTWPNEECRTFAGLRSPTCLMGVKP